MQRVETPSIRSNCACECLSQTASHRGRSDAQSLGRLRQRQVAHAREVLRSQRPTFRWTFFRVEDQVAVRLAQGARVFQQDRIVVGHEAATVLTLGFWDHFVTFFGIIL